MGKIKTSREDIIRLDEVKAFMLNTKSHEVRALIAILYGFGKRISEILNLRCGDVAIMPNGIYIRFRILKRAPEAGILPIRVKGLKRSHWLSPFIEEYYYDIYPRNKQDWFFPGKMEGHMSRVTAWRYLKQVNESIWPHLFRHSLATVIAENGATEQELRNFFDWKTSGMADKYVKENPRLSKKWENRDF